MRLWQPVGLAAMVLGLGGRGEAAESMRTPLRLTGGGQPVGVILLADKPTKAAQFAALELQWHVKAISGATLPIEVSGSGVQGSGKEIRIYVGDSAAAQALGLTQEAFKLQEYAVRSGANEIVLVGKDAPDFSEVKFDLDALGDGSKNANWPGWWEERGTLHAVYDFLQEACGVRWLNPTDTGTVIPRKSTLVVNVKDVRRAPTFRYRDCGVTSAEEGYDRSMSLWGSREDGLKVWQALAYADSRARQGDSLTLKRLTATLFLLRMRNGGEKCVTNHSLYPYYDLYWTPSKDEAAAKYFVEKRPDLFAQGYEGGEPPPQMCYTSTGLVALVAQEARDYFDNGGYTYKATLCTAPVGAKWGQNFFCVEPMDCSAWCRCAGCKPWLPQADTAVNNPLARFNSGSAYKFQFVNAVAREVAKTHPDKFITTLAYMTTLAYPDKVKLEPNVAVSFCLWSNRMFYDTKTYATELGYLKEWAAKDPQRPLYLWLYYLFPAEVANPSQWFCFPGFFAHTIGDQMKTFKKLGVRGMFHCGYGQEVEAYVTFRLMDNADLDVDQLLREYFQGLYGPAAKSLQDFYQLVEKTYADPANYPAGSFDMYGCQTKVAAWETLGTEARMAKLAKLVGKAKTAVVKGTDANRRNVALFEKGVWAYMQAGRAQYLEHKNTPIPAVKAPRVADAGGNTDTVDWSRAAALADPRLPDQWYEQGADKPAARKFSGRIAHDGQWLYLELIDPCDTKKLTAAPSIFPFDDWEIFFARQRAQPYRQYAVGPTAQFAALSDGEVNMRMNVPLVDSGVVAKSDTSAPDKWVVRLAYPLEKVVAGGVKPGEKVYMNATRISGPKLSDKGEMKIATWVSFCSIHDVDRLAEIALE